MRLTSPEALLQAYLDARSADPGLELGRWAQSVPGLLAENRVLAELARRVAAHDGALDLDGAPGLDPSEPGRLIRLERRHGPALLKFLRQYRTCPEQLHGYHLDPELPHDEVVRTLDAWSEGRELRSGWVPQTTWFWQVDGDLAGVISLRHQLTPGLERYGGHIGYSTAPSHRRRGVATHMLRAVLGEALGLGIERVLITCDVDNRPSWRTIERCGGQLLDELWNHDLQRRTRRYVILGRGGEAL